MTEIEGRDGAIFNELGYSVVERPIYVQCLNINKIDDILAWLDGEGEFEYKGRKTTARFYSQLEPQRSACIRIIDTTFIRDPFWYKTNEDYELIKDRKDKQVNGENITLEDCAEVSCDIEIKGNSKQKTRSGKNIFDLNTWFKNVNSNVCTKTLLENGVKLDFKAGADAFIGYIVTSTGTALSESSRKQVIEIEASKKYTLSLSSAPKCYIGFYDENYTSLGYNQIPSNYNKTTYTFTTPATAKYITIRLGIKDQNYTSYTFTNVQLEKNSIATEYEQYGTSPSPDYPSEVKCCGDNIQILKGVEEVTGLTSTGTWANGTWRSASPGTATKTRIDIIDAPNKNIKKGWKFELNAVTGDSDVRSDIAQDNVAVVNGKTYTMSCYARCTKGTGKIHLQYGKTPYPSLSTPLTSDGIWRKYSFTFTIGEKSDGSTDGSTNIYFGLLGHLIVTLEICGLKLVEGTETGEYSKYGQGCINEVICNKNMLNVAILDNYDRNGITLTKHGGTNKIELNGTSTSAFTIYSKDFDINKLKIGEKYTLSKNFSNITFNFEVFENNSDTASIWSPSITMKKSYTRIRIFLQGKSNITFNNQEIVLQLEKGDATEIIEHKEQKYIIPTQKPFRAIGDIRDTFIKKNNKWYERHNTARYIFKGTETVVLQNGGKRIYVKATDNNFLKPKMYIITSIIYPIYCNYLKGATSSDTWGAKVEGISYNTDPTPEPVSHGFDIAINRFTTAQEYLNWFKQKYDEGNPFYVDYILETPEDIECTEEQSTILFDIEQNAKTYKNITHIYSTDEISPNVEVTYLTETTEIITNEGNIKSEPVLLLEKTAYDKVEMSINDVRFKYDFKNDSYVEIDSEEKTIKCNGLNRNRQIIMDYDFPSLNVGNNRILMHSGDCIIKIKRKDRWL